VIPILADENVPLLSVRFLREAGVDIRSVSEIDPRATDQSVLELARAEDRLLATFDRDFGELIYRRDYPAPRGVVFLRFIPATPEEPGEVLQSLLERPDIELDHRFTTVTREQVRQRLLP